MQALRNRETTLTAWFKLNKIDKLAKNIKYVEIPRYYGFTNSKLWKRRERNPQFDAIGRLNIVSPKDIERFFLKLLLNRVKGATSFNDLRTYNNILYRRRFPNLCFFFYEASNVMLPFQLRKFFAWFILAENIPGNLIWNKFKQFLTEDFKDNKENNALSHIQNILKTEDNSCKDYSLPEPTINSLGESPENSAYSKNLFEILFNQLTTDPRLIFTEIVNDKNKIYFIDGPGGSGKTFIYKTLIHYFLSLNKKILSMAWTGIASILLPKDYI